MAVVEVEDRTLQVEVWRGHEQGRYQTFHVPHRANQTVLDVVTWIQRHAEPALAYRFACRVGVCGSCAMTVNGRPRWTCRTHVAKVTGTNGRLRIEPLANLPRIKDLAIGLWQRAWVFLRRAGTIIFVVTIALWLMLSFPKAEPGESQMDASVAGRVADVLHPVLEPIGFNREMSLALIPAMAAREVAVSALAMAG